MNYKNYKNDNDFMKGYNRVYDFCTFANSYCKDLYFELLNKNPEIIPLIEKKKYNTIDGRRGKENKGMGITIKVINKQNNLSILLEPRINSKKTDHFKSSFLKGVSGISIEESDLIFFKSTGILVLDNPTPKYYYLYRYSQVPQNNISKGNKGTGNARRFNLNGLNLNRIPIAGRKDNCFPELDLETAIIKMIKEMNK